MNPDLILSVTFEGKVLSLPAYIMQFGYVARLNVEIQGMTVTFERDEESKWRAVIGYADLIADKKVKKELLEAVADVIDELTK